jgi:hypothetical protein
MLTSAGQRHVQGRRAISVEVNPEPTMGWVDWKALTAAQKTEAVRMRPTWKLSQFRDFEFWIRKDGHVSERRGGGSHQLSARACNDELRKYGDDVRTKGDLREWKPGVTYHFVRD